MVSDEAKFNLLKYQHTRRHSRQDDAIDEILLNLDVE
jgi:hypothetical protein